MHIYSPPQVTTQNFMPICHSCQAVWILQYTSDDELGAMDLIWYVVFVQVKHESQGSQLQLSIVL